ncbi:Uncharacterized protein FKW44_014717 [Caligus rogercresseyi]|uniref:Uncharacterized protein n=1 Tax=Caligus rogercresseyi TaxID=217165 RepID=A0A7T8GZD1_CALRO|nr:Uncharacterized protein FKW44_014717 [Caligus rogercresseyi]
MSALRGSGQRILAYSFYDDPHTSDTLNRNFFKGIKENLDGIREQYNSKNSGLESTFNFTPHQNICEIPRSNKLFPMLWRFLPVQDQEVEVLFSRDLDSRITPREIHAVREFMSTNKSIHAMRDHMQHGTEILGGMWGARLGILHLRMLIENALYRLLRDPVALKPRTERGHDQVLLTKYMWWGFALDSVPLMSKLGLTHDSYHCRRYPGSQAFPSKRPIGVLNFVGAVADMNNTIHSTEGNKCPKECRPKNHQDWEFC